MTANEWLHATLRFRFRFSIVSRDWIPTERSIQYLGFRLPIGQSGRTVSSVENCFREDHGRICLRGPSKNALKVREAGGERNRG